MDCTFRGAAGAASPTMGTASTGSGTCSGERAASSLRDGLERSPGRAFAATRSLSILSRDTWTCVSPATLRRFNSPTRASIFSRM